MHSSLEKILTSSRRLPADLRAVFEGYFMHDKSIETICQEQGISREEFQARHDRILREMRAVAN